jgi:hypothetical protein
MVRRAARSSDVTGFAPSRSPRDRRSGPRLVGDSYPLVSRTRDVTDRRHPAAGTQYVTSSRPTGSRLDPVPRRRRDQDVEAPPAVVPFFERRLLDGDVAKGRKPAPSQHIRWVSTTVRPDRTASAIPADSRLTFRVVRIGRWTLFPDLESVACDDANDRRVASSTRRRSWRQAGGSATQVRRVRGRRGRCPARHGRRRSG